MGYRRVYIYWCMGDAILFSYLDKVKNSKQLMVLTEKSNERFSVLYEPKLLRE